MVWIPFFHEERNDKGRLEDFSCRDNNSFSNYIDLKEKISQTNYIILKMYNNSGIKWVNENMSIILEKQFDEFNIYTNIIPNIWFKVIVQCKMTRGRFWRTF